MGKLDRALTLSFFCCVQHSDRIIAAIPSLDNRTSNSGEMGGGGDFGGDGASGGSDMGKKQG